MKRKKRFVTSFSVSADKVSLMDALEEIAAREKVSFSRAVVKALEEFVEKHRVGNPQRTLFPLRSVESGAFPLEKRVQNLEWLKSLVKRNPGRPDVFWVHKFSELSGLRPETVRSYIRTLLVTGSLTRKSGKLYAKENVSAEGET